LLELLQVGRTNWYVTQLPAVKNRFSDPTKTNRSGSMQKEITNDHQEKAFKRAVMKENRLIEASLQHRRLTPNKT